MLAQREQPVRHLEAEVTFVADFEPILLTIDGLHAFQIQLSEPNEYPSATHYLCLYYDDQLADKVELRFNYGTPYLTTLGAFGLSGQRVSIRVVQSHSRRWVPWIYSPWVSHARIRASLLRWWCVSAVATYGRGQYWLSRSGSAEVSARLAQRTGQSAQRLRLPAQGG